MAMAMGLMTQSCALDEPFSRDGEGVLQMKLVINSDVTRAENDQDALSENCVVYISGAKGLIHKYVGLENVPEQLDMKAGHYVAEAWTGDSVTASFDKKFFRGYQPFDISTGLNQVVLNCKIQNTVVSVNPATVDMNLMKDFNIKVENSRGSLDFTAENYDSAKGYFMMPNGDTNLKVIVSGVNSENKEFSKMIMIEDVKRTHEYVLNIGYNPRYEEEGGSFVTITVDDSEVLVESEVEIFGRPYVKGVGFDIDKQIVGGSGLFKTQVLKVKAFGGIEHMLLTCEDWETLGLVENAIDLKHCTEAVATQTRNSGLDWDETYNAEKNVATSFITLSADFLNRLPERDQEYVLKINVTDKYGKTIEQNVRFAVGEGAIVIDDPVTVDEPDYTSDLMAIVSTKATLSGSIVNPDATNPGLQYREAGTSAWQFAPANSTAVAAASKRRSLSKAQILRAPGTKFSVTLTGLKPGTRYEYRPAADGFESTESKFFTTEGTFSIPNGGFEEWGTYKGKVPVFGTTKDIVIPSIAGNQEDSFWSSGNQGAGAANMVLTDKYTGMVHSGQYSCRLESKSALGVLAAGNVFSGIFAGTEDGTNGILDLGREYDGSHPSAVRVWANYRPGAKCSVKESGLDITDGGTDHGQIYVALVSDIVEIHTSSTKRQLMSPDRSEVIAFGEVTWKGNFGADNTLEMIDIPFEYNSKAKTVRPKYMVIVCAASKYGDYFSGSVGSVMVLDDFQFVYE